METNRYPQETQINIQNKEDRDPLRETPIENQKETPNLNTEVTVVYDSKTLAALKVHRMFGQTNLRDDTLLTVPTVERWNVTSACTHCVPLDGHRRRDPDFSKQSIFNWEEMFYHRGVPLGRVYSMGSLTSCANASVASCITNNNNFLGFARSMRRPRSCHATQVGIWEVWWTSDDGPIGTSSTSSYRRRTG